MLRLLSDQEIIDKYGDPAKFLSSDGSVSAAWGTAILDSFALQKPLPLAWGGTVTRVTCHKLVRGELEDVLGRLAAIPNVWATIGDYGGVYNFRRIRNSPSKLSRHSWGIAIDLDVADNPQGGRGNMHPLIIQAFYDIGWLWGGWFTGTPDPMHFEKAGRF